MRVIELYEAQRWLQIALPGDAGIYWRGHLASNKNGNRKLQHLSAALMRLAPTHVHLYQRRVPDYGYDYIVHVRKRMTKLELAVHFDTGSRI
jgi:hypothetical protein